PTRTAVPPAIDDAHYAAPGRSYATASRERSSAVTRLALSDRERLRSRMNRFRLVYRRPWSSAVASAAAGPRVEDVRRALFVVAPVGASGLHEAVALVEPLRCAVGGERPEPQSFRTVTL